MLVWYCVGSLYDLSDYLISFLFIYCSFCINRNWLVKHKKRETMTNTYVYSRKRTSHYEVWRLWSIMRLEGKLMTSDDDRNEQFAYGYDLNRIFFSTWPHAAHVYSQRGLYSIDDFPQGSSLLFFFIFS